MPKRRQILATSPDRFAYSSTASFRLMSRCFSVIPTSLLTKSTSSIVKRGRERQNSTKQGSPHLRWALVQATQHAARRPDRSRDGECYFAVKQPVGSQPATLSIARKIAKRACHVLEAAEDAA